MEILETKGQLECHCCCSSNDVFICELDTINIKVIFL